MDIYDTDTNLRHSLSLHGYPTNSGEFVLLIIHSLLALPYCFVGPVVLDHDCRRLKMQPTLK